MSLKKIFVLGAALTILVIACKKDPQTGDPFAYDPTPYQLQIPKAVGWTSFPIPADNPMTVAGVELGKKLFFDPILSVNNERSCATCHKPNEYFTDTAVATSLQLNNKDVLSRNTPSLINVQFNHLSMLDGKFYTLQHQGKAVITNPIEMGSDEVEVVIKVLNVPEYKKGFKKSC